MTGSAQSAGVYATAAITGYVKAGFQLALCTGVPLLKVPFLFVTADISFTVYVSHLLSPDRIL